MTVCSWSPGADQEAPIPVIGPGGKRSLGSHPRERFCGVFWALTFSEELLILVPRMFHTEAHVSTLQCPRCDFKFPDGGSGDNWAKVAVSTLIAAPAVPDMATQVRCPNCHHLFAEGEVRHLRSTWSGRVSPWLAILGIALVAWLFTS